MYTRRTVKCILIVVMWLAVSPALAGNLFLNGVNINGVTNQKFENCNVTIDANGDVFIEAPGYAVSAVNDSGPVRQVAKPASTSSEKPTKRYWLIKEENRPGEAQYDVDVYVNSVWLKQLHSDGQQVVKEITDYLRPGQNVIHLVATKNIGEKRNSESPEAYLKVIIGEGNIGGNNVLIEAPLVQYKRTAKETQNMSDDYSVTAR